MVAGGGSVLIDATPALDKLEVLVTRPSASTSCVAPWRSHSARSRSTRAWRVPSSSRRFASFPAAGYDAAKGEYADLFATGIIDPAKVTRSALENASSVASLLLTTETIVTDIPEKEKAAMPAWAEAGLRPPALTDRSRGPRLRPGPSSLSRSAFSPGR